MVLLLALKGLDIKEEISVCLENKKVEEFIKKVHFGRLQSVRHGGERPFCFKPRIFNLRVGGISEAMKTSIGRERGLGGKRLTNMPSLNP